MSSLIGYRKYHFDQNCWKYEQLRRVLGWGLGTARRYPVVVTSDILFFELKFKFPDKVGVSRRKVRGNQNSKAVLSFFLFSLSSYRAYSVRKCKWWDFARRVVVPKNLTSEPGVTIHIYFIVQEFDCNLGGNTFITCQKEIRDINFYTRPDVTYSPIKLYSNYSCEHFENEICIINA